MIRILVSLALSFFLVSFYYGCSGKTEVGWKNGDSTGYVQGDYEYDEKEWNDLSECSSSDESCISQYGNPSGETTEKKEVEKTTDTLTLSVYDKNDETLKNASTDVTLDKNKSQIYEVDTDIDEN